MTHIQCLIFSKDRAMQLDALLLSMMRYAPAFWPPTILCDITSSDSHHAYQILAAAWDEVIWRPQPLGEFGRYVTSNLQDSYELSSLLVDDCIFFHEVPEIRILPGRSYSLRLGDGVTDGYVVPGAALQRVGGYSLDGNVHLTRELKNAICRVKCSGPNELEAQLNSREDLTVLEEHGPQNCLVNIPHNLVQSVFPNNRNMGGSAAELTARFLRGERIDLDAMDFSHVVDCHQPIPYVFCGRPLDEELQLLRDL